MFDLIWFDEPRVVEPLVFVIPDSRKAEPEQSNPFVPPTPPVMSDGVYTVSRRRHYRNLKGKNRRAW